ncbi:CYIR protein, partial [Plasmodium cynomolgi strain B]
MFKLKSTCNPEKIKGVNLNELKIGYFQIKKISNENGKVCNKYLTYLKSFKSVHDEYMDRHCGSLTVFSSNGTDYFSCNDKDELTSLINEFEKCKSVEKPNPEIVHDIPA